jgi:hypothetical protein
MYPFLIDNNGFELEEGVFFDLLVLDKELLDLIMALKLDFG